MSKTIKVAVVEDEADIQDILAYNLQREGYEVVLAGTGEDGLKLIREERPDLALLDIMLPGMSGIEICRQMKMDTETRNIPSIMVSAKGEEIDVVLGLEVGADDYVSKPFSPRELLARIKSVLRRAQAKGEEEVERKIVSYGPFHIDTERHEARINDEEVKFTATEFRLLYVLVSSPGRVFTREQLMDKVIGDQAIVIDRNIDVHIRSIRRKLGAERDRIETIRSVGYRLRD